MRFHSAMRFVWKYDGISARRTARSGPARTRAYSGRKAPFRIRLPKTLGLRCFVFAHCPAQRTITTIVTYPCDSTPTRTASACERDEARRVAANIAKLPGIAAAWGCDDSPKM